MSALLLGLGLPMLSRMILMLIEPMTLVGTSLIRMVQTCRGNL